MDNDWGSEPVTIHTNEVGVVLASLLLDHIVEGADDEEVFVLMDIEYATR